jgi:hypothetical protein
MAFPASYGSRRERKSVTTVYARATAALDAGHFLPTRPAGTCKNLDLTQPNPTRVQLWGTVLLR